MRSRVQIFLKAGAVLCLICAAYSRCFDYGLVNLDDYAYIYRHAEVVSFQGLKSLAWFFTNVDEGIWMPLTWISYALDSYMFGTWYGGFHVHSVLVHAVNAILVWHLLVLLFQADNERYFKFCCLTAALAWAIHPLRCESVVFLASRKDVLSLFWELLALLAWVRGSRSELKPRVFLTTLSLAFFVTGAMCKPSVMTFPLLCLLIDVFIIKSVRPYRYIMPLILMLGLAMFATWQQSSGGATVQGSGESVMVRLSYSIAAFGIYLRNTVLPFWLAVQCTKHWPDMPRFFMPGIAISALWVFVLLKRFRSYWQSCGGVGRMSCLENWPVFIKFNMPTDYVVAGMAWFAIAIAPMLDFVPFGYHAFADRFTYIPSLGLSIMLIVGLVALRRWFQFWSLELMAAILILALAVTTWHQTGYWRNDLTLFTHTVEIDGDKNDVAHKNIGVYYFEFEHDLEKAKAHFEAALKADKRFILENIDVYAITLIELGLDNEALSLLRRCEQILSEEFGHEKAYAICRGYSLLYKWEYVLSQSYRYARIAIWLGSDKSLAQARDELESLRESCEQDGIWQYLIWRYFSLSGEIEKAETALKRLLDASNKNGFVQFRYLRRSI